MKQNKLLFLILLIIPHSYYALVGPVLPGENLWCISRDINLTAQTILDQLSTFSCNCPESCNIIPLSQSNVIGGNLIISTSGHYCLQEDITLASPSGTISLNDDTIYLDLNNRLVNGSIVVNGNFDTVTNGVILAPRPTTITTPNEAGLTINSNNCEISYCTIFTADIINNSLQSRNGINNFGESNVIVHCYIQAGQATFTVGFPAPLPLNGGDGILCSGNNGQILDCIITTSNGASSGFFGGSIGGNGGNGVVVSTSFNVIKSCIIMTGNGSDAFGVNIQLQPFSGGNGGFGIWVQNTALNCFIANNLVKSTGKGGINTSQTPAGTGQAGHGIQIDAGATGIEVVNNIFSNTGTFTGTPEFVANKGGLAVNDLTTSTTQTFIYENFAYNIAQDTPSSIRYKIHNSVTEAGVISPNPPTSALINFIANVFTN